MDKLTAVNNILKMIGTRPVSSTETKHVDVVDTLAAIDDWVDRVCSYGWWFNKRYNVILARDNHNEVRMASSYLSFEHVHAETQRRYPNLAILGGKLYDTQRNSFVFDFDPVLTLWVKVPWEVLPVVAQEYVMYNAGADIVRDKIEDSYKEASLKRTAEERFVRLDAEQLRVNPVNMYDSPYVARMRAGRRPINRR